MLSILIKKYKEMGYNVVERKRGRSSTMKKEIHHKTIEEENKSKKS